MSDAIESPLPEAVRKHWWWRPGWKPGRHYYACHLTLDDQPQLRTLVAIYQQAIQNLPGLALIPAPWLHITMQGMGFTDEIGPAELDELAEALTRVLSRIDPPTVSFRHLTVHPEAIYLKAHPADALYPLRTGMHRAAASVLGPDRFTENMPDREHFNPHVSIAYVSADGEVQPIAQALCTAAPPTATATFHRASLLEFHRDNRMYEWTSSTPIAIGSAYVPERTRAHPTMTPPSQHSPGDKHLPAQGQPDQGTQLLPAQRRRPVSERGEDVELVALRIGEACPRHVVALADVDVSGAERA